MQSYHDLLFDIVSKGRPHNNRTATPSLSLFGYEWRHNMHEGFPLLTTKKMPYRVIFEELAWFLRGSTDNKELQDRKVTIWDEWATAEQCAKFGRKENDLGPIYGWQWRHYGATYISLHLRLTELQMFPNINSGFDQIAWLLNEIKTNPNSRRLIVNAWNPIQANDVTLPPCHCFFQMKVNDDQMSMEVYMRSCDAFLGLPFNIASYATLLQMLCCKTNYYPGELVFMFGDLHLYADHMQQVNTVLNRNCLPLPRLVINSDIDIFNPKYENVKLLDYVYHPAIPAPVAV